MRYSMTRGPRRDSRNQLGQRVVPEGFDEKMAQQLRDSTSALPAD